MSDLDSRSAYQKVGATRAMNNMPRFGHSANFADLFSDTEARQDYGRGLIFAGTLILSIFLAWAVMLLVFMCLGQRKVGFLSGAPFTVDKANKRPLRCRLTFMISGACVIVFGVLLVTQGVTNVRDTVDTLVESNQAVRSLVTDASEISASLRSVGETTATVRNELETYLGNLCPAEPNVEQITGFDFEGLSNQAIDLLDTLDGFLANELTTLDNAIETVNKTTEDIDNGADNIDINDWQALIILIPIIIIPTILMVGTMMAWFEVSNPIVSCIISWVIMPLFILIAVAAFVGSGAVAIASVVNADWCSGSTDFADAQLAAAQSLSFEDSPDNTILDIMSNQQVDTESLVFRAVVFYISQCRSDDPWEFVRQYEGEISNARSQVGELYDAFQSVGVSDLGVLCGRDFGPLDILIQTVRTDLDILFENVASVIDLVRCSRIVPIYTGAVYEGTCTYSVTGITWVWSACLVIAFGSFMMLTLRSSLKPTAYVEEEGEKQVDYPATQPENTFEEDMAASSPSYSERYSGSFQQDEGNVYSAGSPNFRSKTHNSVVY